MMHNEEVDLSIEDCRQEMHRLKGLIEMVGIMSPISNFLTKYAAIRCCGALEQGYKSIIADYYEQFSDQLVSFISTHVRESSKNPSLANICTILTAFDEDKCANFKDAVKRLDNAARVRESLDSINKVRNNVAHGINVSMSFNEIIEHFERSLKIIECLDSVLSD